MMNWMYKMEFSSNYQNHFIHDAFKIDEKVDS